MYARYAKFRGQGTIYRCDWSCSEFQKHAQLAKREVPKPSGKVETLADFKLSKPDRTSLATPGIIISAPASGAGKTTITLGILRALRDEGLNVSAAKLGPTISILNSMSGPVVADA